MGDLVRIERNDVYTDSMAIATYAELQHRSVARLISLHITDFEEYGRVYFRDFKSRNSGRGRPVKVYDLNQMQAMLLITYLDNTSPVREFKKALIRELKRMNLLLAQRQTAEWQAARLETKRVRLQETDAIKQLVEYAKAQGSKNAEKIYLTYSKLVKSLAGYDTRDTAPAEILELVSTLERILAGLITQEMEAETHYKAIYKKAKAELQAIRDRWSVVPLRFHKKKRLTRVNE